MNEIHDRKDRILNDRTQISFAYIDVEDGMSWWQLEDFGDGFGHFGRFYISIGHIQKMSPRSKFSHQHPQIDVTNITVTDSVTLVSSKEVKLKIFIWLSGQLWGI